MDTKTQFILLCVPDPLPAQLPLRDHEEAVITALNIPPRSRRSSWFLPANEGPQPSRTELGITREDPFGGIRVTVAWNGSVVCQVPLETTGGTWGYKPIDGVPVVNPLAIIEPIVKVFALMKHLSQYLDGATAVQVRAVMRNASRVNLTPFRSDSYAFIFEHFKHDPNIVKCAERDEVTILPKTIELSDLDDPHARDIAVEFFKEAGFDMSDIKLPFFDDAGNFDLK